MSETQTTAAQTSGATVPVPVPDRGNPLPPWWGWPDGHWRQDVPGTVGPNGFAVTVNTDLLLHRGIHAQDTVWINPDRPAQPGEVVLARFPDDTQHLGVWIKTDVGFAEQLQADGPPPWGSGYLAGAWSGKLGPETFTVVGPAVYVEMTVRHHQPVPGHAPFSTGWTEPWGNWNKPWTYAGQTSARVELAGLDGEPYVLSLSAVAPGGGRLYLPAKDQTRTRQLVETARRAAWADLRPLRPESTPAEAPQDGES